MTWAVSGELPAFAGKDGGGGRKPNCQASTAHVNKVLIESRQSAHVQHTRREEATQTLSKPYVTS